MSKILFIYEQLSPTVSLTMNFYKSSAKYYKLDARFLSLRDITSKELSWADIIYFIRPTDYLSINIAKSARQSGKIIISYYDDDLLNRPNNKPIVSWRKNNVLKMLNQSNIIVSSSSRICRKYKEYTVDKRCVQKHTIVRNEELRSNDKQSCNDVRIIYSGNKSHSSLIDKYITPIIPEFSQLKEKIIIYFIGVHPDFKMVTIPNNVKIKYVEIMPFGVYRKYMNTHDFDIGLAPIQQNEFSKCKYFNKFLEYSMFQIPGIYSYSQPFTDVVVNGENGILVENNAEDWKKALFNLIQNKELRDSLGINALQTVRQYFNEKRIMSDFLRQIPELIDYDSGNSKVKLFLFYRLVYLIMKLHENIYLSYSYIKNVGVFGFYNKVKKHLEEKRAFRGKNI